MGHHYQKRLSRKLRGCRSAPDVADVVAARCVAAHVADEAHQRVPARAVIHYSSRLTCSHNSTISEPTFRKTWASYCGLASSAAVRQDRPAVCLSGLDRFIACRYPSWALINASHGCGDGKETLGWLLLTHQERQWLQDAGPATFKIDECQSGLVKNNVLIGICRLTQSGGGGCRGSCGVEDGCHVSVQGVTAAEEPVCRALQAAVTCPQRCLSLLWSNRTFPSVPNFC